MSDVGTPSWKASPITQLIVAPFLTAGLVVLLQHFLGPFRVAEEARIAIKREVVLKQQKYLAMAYTLAELSLEMQVHVLIQKTRYVSSDTNYPKPIIPDSITVKNTHVSVPVIASDTMLLHRWDRWLHELDDVQFDLDHRIVQDLRKIVRVYQDNRIPSIITIRRSDGLGRVPMDRLEYLRQHTKWADSTFLSEWHQINQQLQAHVEEIRRLE